MLCYGDGRFILSRHRSGMTADEWQIGAIDAYGSELTSFLTCENAASMGMIRADSMDVGYDSYKDLRRGELSPVSRYLVDDIYFLYTGNDMFLEDCLYNASTGEIQAGVHSSSLFVPQEMVDGHIVTISGGYSIIVETVDFEFENEFNTASSQWDNIDAQFRNGLFFSAQDNYDDPNNFDYRRGYYDLYGNQVISLDDFYPELDWRQIWGFPFYDGYAVVEIKGQDRNLYVTVINESAEQQFEPMQVDSVLSNGSFREGAFAVKSVDGSRLFVSPSGESIHNFSNDLPEKYTYWISEPYCVLRYEVNDDYYYSYFNLKDVLAAGVDRYKLNMPALSDGIAEEFAGSAGKTYSNISDFTIEGKWKSTGEYGFGQAQPGAIVVFDGNNCNFYSPKDTYAFYPDGDGYTLDVTSFQSTDSQSFLVKTIDENHIDVMAGGETTELTRIG